MIPQDRTGANIIRRYIEYFVVTIIIALLPSLLNVKNAVYATSITGINIVSSILFLLVWLLYGYYNGNKKRKEFIWFLITYSAICIILTFLGRLISITILYGFVVFTSLTPMYGLYYYINSLKINAPLSFYLLILCMSIIPMVGYIVGNKVSNKLKDFTT